MDSLTDEQTRLVVVVDGLTYLSPLSRRFGVWTA